MVWDSIVIYHYSLVWDSHVHHYGLGGIVMYSIMVWGRIVPLWSGIA